MPRLREQAPQEGFARPPFDYHAEQRALEAQVRRMVQSIAETTASLPNEPLDFGGQESPSARPFRWRDANWGLIGALIFTVLAWWVILTSAAPALRGIFSRIAA